MLKVILSVSNEKLSEDFLVLYGQMHHKVFVTLIHNNETIRDIERTLKILRYLILIMFLVIVSFTGSGCMSAKKASRDFWKRANSSCDLSHMGRNKKFYSAKYQRDLIRSERSIRYKYHSP